MENRTQPEQNQRTRSFVSAVGKLMDDGTIRTYRELAEAIDYDATSITNIIKGRRNVPVEVYRKFAEAYNLQPVADPFEVILENSFQARALATVALRAVAELLASERNESVTKTLTDLEVALGQELQKLKAGLG